LFGKPIVVIDPVITERSEVGECWPLRIDWFVRSWRDRRSGVVDAKPDVIDEARLDIDVEGCR
jgi:hypothetical protein